MLPTSDSNHFVMESHLPKRERVFDAAIVFPKSALVLAISLIGAGTVIATYASVDGIKPRGSGYGIDEYMSATVVTGENRPTTIR